MTDSHPDMRGEVERIRRVSDLLCTAHAQLRDRYARRAFALDLTILVLSAWLTALAFLDPRYNKWIIPEGVDPQFAVGVFGFLVFGLTLLQVKTDWKGRSEAHKRSFSMYSEVKREAGYLLASAHDIPSREFQRLAARYDMSSDVGTAVPESDFLSLKRQHKIKLAISRVLDARPGANIMLIKLCIVLRDNLPQRKK